MRVAIIGSRDYPNLAAVDAAVDALPPTAVVVSGAARGVDRRAADRARIRGLSVEEHPADWDRLGRSAGLRRNEEMLSSCDRVIAFWFNESRGTAHAIRVAKQRGIPVVVIGVNT